DVPTADAGSYKDLDAAQLSGVPAFDRAMADRVRDDTAEERKAWEHEAVSYLLHEARNTPAVHSYRRNLLPINAGSGATIAKDSKPWRLQFVRFRGALESIREENYEINYAEAEPPIGQVHRGRVRVAGGGDVRVVFIYGAAPMWADPNEATARPETKLITDGWVRGRGIVVKNFIDVDGGDSTPAILVVATRIDRDYAPVPVNSLADIPFSIIDDDPTHADNEDQRVVLAKEYPRPLFRLVRYASARAGKAGAELRKSEKLEAGSLSEKDYETLIGKPAQFRAKYYGSLGAIALEPLQYGASTITANDAGVQECLNGWIMTDQRKLIQFVAPIELAGTWKLRDRIRWEGFFYKTKLYPAQNGTDRLVPLFVLTRLEKVPPPPRDYWTQVVIAGGFLIGIALLVFLVVREDKTKSDYLASRRRTIAPAKP
ncbi:MAG: hypothetical protein OER88_13000, partial [Planctomycetota bacterium]|nr:hypothetical protein [Planctomycetota bacterium]